MFLGAGEIVVVLAVALMVLGPKKMPEVARKLARLIGQARRMADDVRGQVDDAMREPPQTSEPRGIAERITHQGPGPHPRGSGQTHDAAPKPPEAP